jgi:hypothetical protein
MKVVKVTQNSIVIDPPKAKGLQHVPKGDFEKVWETWPAYKSGKFKWQEFTLLTRFSVYIIAILHWLEQD